MNVSNIETDNLFRSVTDNEDEFILFILILTCIIKPKKTTQIRQLNINFSVFKILKVDYLLHIFKK
jgi:hypothetical protein